MRRGVEVVLMKVEGKLFRLLLLTVLTTITLHAQDIPIGTWRTHFSYLDVRHVAPAASQGRIYAATRNALFYYDLEDNSLNKLTKLDGLSDVGITALKYSATEDVLVVGYASGIVDFLSGNELTTLRDIANSNQLQDKHIGDIEVNDGLVYLAISVGVVLADIESLSIVESYTEIGPDASELLVRDIEILGDSIFLATREGVLSASLSPSLNLQDFRNWRVQSNPNVRSIRFIQKNGTNLLVSDGLELFELSSGVWSDLGFSLNVQFEGLRLSESSSFIILNGAESTIINQDLSLKVRQNLFIQEVAEVSGRLFLASKSSGLLEDQGGTPSRLELNGPASDEFRTLTITGDRVFALGEFFNIIKQPLGNPGSYSQYLEGQWSQVSPTNVMDISSVSIDGNTFIGSFGEGVLVEEIGEILSLPNSDDDAQVTSVFSNSSRRLYVSTYDANPSIHIRNEDLTWNSVALGSSSVGRYPIEIKVSPLTEVVWVRVDPDQGGGMFAYNPESNLVRRISTSSSQLPANRVNSFAIDRSDEVWIGTTDGIAFFQSSLSPFFDDFNNAITPIFEGDLLLKGENVRAIAIDGGSRKWIGTDRGLWLFAENGDQLIERYTKGNSPLPSDTIKSIAIDRNGEVFIATTRGVVSFRTDASTSNRFFSNVKVFPNPVTPGYQGLIGINGLATDANVKITDVSGRLIREVRANGGTASWDGMDLNGFRTKTGVYLIFSSDEEGVESFVGKLAVVR